MDWGDKLAWLEDLAAEDGIEPKALAARPQLRDDLEFQWNAWWELHTDRPIGWGGAGPIPFASIDRYAGRFGIEDVDEFDGFCDLMRQMDRVYLDWSKKRQGKGK